MTEKNKATDLTLTNKYSIRVRFNEADPLGIVWHGNYLRYFEDGREAFGREHGLSYRNMEENKVATPIVKSLCEHKYPLQYDEVFTVKTTYVDSAAAKLIFRYELINQQGKIVCTGETVQVFTELSTGELLLNLPDFVVEWKKKVGLL